ncbi:hypothetical protein DP939_09400 [Spongiactinospora rosea]|uniref:Uncharacterized protein n=1 Tax=Spongiactinospora rosea TaxID=2248750 RepID=A0A366M1I3_9ACTN|nr:hypothetical protein [Spongiactinospora rosea]RBQ20036.1 hypothetical protein DP939_09400 [Spongiactinospora rosea]
MSIRLFRAQEMAVAMGPAAYPEPGVLLARLARLVGESVPAEGASGDAFLQRLAGRLGLQTYDLFLVADAPIPDHALLFDESARLHIVRLIERALRLSASGRGRLREHVRSLPRHTDALAPRKERSWESYPPGYGSLLMRMLELRNMNWTLAVKARYLTYGGMVLSASTIGAVARCVRPLDIDTINGFAAILGVPASVIACLMGMPDTVATYRPPEEIVETARLLWDVRQLTERQMGQVSALAQELCHEGDGG